MSYGGHFARYGQPAQTAATTADASRRWARIALGNNGSTVSGSNIRRRSTLIRHFPGFSRIADSKLTVTISRHSNRSGIARLGAAHVDAAFGLVETGKPCSSPCATEATAGITPRRGAYLPKLASLVKPGGAFFSRHAQASAFTRRRPAGDARDRRTGTTAD